MAADGWLADRLLRWEPPETQNAGHGVTLWESAWASEDEAKEFAYAVGRAIEDGLAGAAVEDKREGCRSWRASDKMYRLDRHTTRVTLRIAPVELDARLDAAPTEIKKPQPSPPPPR